MKDDHRALDRRPPWVFYWWFGSEYGGIADSIEPGSAWNEVLDTPQGRHHLWRWLLTRSDSTISSSLSSKATRNLQRKVVLSVFRDLLQTFRISKSSAARLVQDAVQALADLPPRLGSIVLARRTFDGREVISLRVRPDVRLLRSSVNTQDVVVGFV